MELLQSHLLHMMLDQWSRAAAEERPVLNNNNLHDESREPLQDHNPLHGPPSSSSSSPSLQKNEELRQSAEQLLNIVATYFVTIFSPKSDPHMKTKAVTASEAERVACLELTTKLYAIVAERTPDLLAAPAHHHTASYFVQSGLQCVLDGTSAAQERDAAVTMLTAVVSCLGSSTARAVLPGVASGISKFLAHAVPLRMRNEGKERVSFLVQVLLFFQRLLAKCFPEGPSVDTHHAEKGDVAAAANAIWSKLAPFLHLLLDSEKLVASIFQQGPRALSEALLSFTMEAIHSLKRSAVVGTPAPQWSTSSPQVPSSPEHFLRSWTVTALTLWATQQPDLVATAALPSLPEALVSLPSGALTVDMVEWLLTLYWTTSVTTAERNVSLEQRGAPLAVLFALLCLEKPKKAKKSKKKDKDASNVLQTDEIVASTQRWEMVRAFLGKNIRRTGKGGELLFSLKGTSTSLSSSFLWPSIKRAIRVLSEWPERSQLQQTRSERTGGTSVQTCSLLDVIESFLLACGGQIGSLVAMEEEGEEEERDDVDESSLNNPQGERDPHADGGARNRSKERCRDEMALLLGDWDAYQLHQAALFVSCRLEAGTLLGLGHSSQREHIMRKGSCPMREPKQKKIAAPLPETRNEGSSVRSQDDPPVLCKRCQKQADQWFAASSFELLWEEHLGLPHLWQIEDQQEELSFQQGRHRAQMACTILGCLRLLASSLSALSPRHVQRWTVLTLYNVLEKASSAHEDVRLAAMKTIQALGRLHHVDALSSEGTLLFVHQFSSCLVEDAKLAIQDPEVRQSALYVLTALLQLAQQEVSAWGSNVSSSSSTSSCRVVDGGNAARMLDVVCHMLHHVIDTVAWSLTWDRSAVTPLRQCVSTVHQLVMRYPRRNPPEDDWDHDDEHRTTSTEPAVAQLQRSLEGALLVMHRLLLHSRGEKAHLAIPIAVSIVRLFQKSPESDSDTKKPPPTGEMPPQDENPAPQMNEEGVKEEEELPSSSSSPAPPPMTTDLIIRTQLTTVHMVYSALFQILSAPLSNADLPSLFAIVSAPEFAAADVIRRPSSTSSSPLSSSMTAAMRRVKWLLDVAITLDVIEAVAGMSQLVALAPAFLGQRVRSEVVRIVLVYYIRCARLTNIPTTRELKLVQAVTAFLETLETVVLGVTLRETAADGGSGGAADEPTSLIRLIVKKEHLPAPK